MSGRRWGRLASVSGAVGAVVAGVAVNQVGGGSAWPWQVAMAVIAAIAMWAAASLGHVSAAGKSASPSDSADLGPVPEEVSASGGTGIMMQTREARGGIHMHGSTGVLPVPRQLPTDPSLLVGRDTDLAALDELLTNSDEARAVVIFAIAGGGGVGKTTLAVHWAHRVRDRFPDGDLFVNLRGYDPGQPMKPEQVLSGFLRALEVPAEKIPAELDAQAALFRSLLDGRRMLVVLDNAASAEQVRPLLPAAAGCLTLITSRSRLSGLATREGVGRVPIDVLSSEHALALLRQVIGDSRVDAEADMAAELARYCGYLPLALRIAADRAVIYPHLMLTDLVDELADERDLLDILAGDDETTAVRAVFSWSYNKLPPEAARVFRLLGLNAGPDVSTEAAAALTGLTLPRARRLLDMLTSQHLLEQTERNRYRLHDLLRVYAAECATNAESEAERFTALQRMLNWYLNTARAARRIILPNHYEIPINHPGLEHPPLAFTTHDEARIWYEQERTNLVTAVRQAAEDGHDPVAWKLAHTLGPFFIMIAWNLDDCLDTMRIGLAAAQRLGDQSAHALMLLNIGEIVDHLKRFEEAIEYNQRALKLSRNISASWIEGFSHNDLGRCYLELHRFDEAAHHFRQALAIFRDTEERRGEGAALSNFGLVYQHLGRSEEAISHHKEAVSIFEESASEADRMGALRDIGVAYYDLRHFDQAIKYHRQALHICREKRYRRDTALTLAEIGKAQLANRQTSAARNSWQEALAIFTDLRHPLADEIKTRLESVATDPPEA